ncbi:taurine ABC transporter substrate-binding protein [Lachnospiraceae bacterium]|nr:taurine ABC transporter substrate-binding protein [Lachnospiraceae bacterium]
MKKVISILLTLALVATLTGCGSSPEPATSAPAEETAATEEAPAEEAAPVEEEASAEEEAPAEEAAEESYEPVTLNIAYMPNYGSLWSVLTAKEKGYFEEVGITVEMVEFADGPTIIAAMESGSIDIGYIGQGAHKLCINGQASIFALSHISNGDALIGGAGITKIEDLAGKKVAYSSGSSSEDILLNSLNSVGMTMDDIEAVDMDAAAIVTAMLSGGVDACATWSPNSLKILEEMSDATKLSDNMTFADTTVSLASWIVMPSYAEANRDILVRFTKGLFKAMDYAADDHYDEVAQYVAAQVAQDYDSVYEQRGDADWLTGKEVSEGAANGEVEQYYEIQKQGFVAAGAVEADPVPAVSDYVMLDVMIEAGK